MNRNQLTVKQIDYKSTDYQKELHIRNEVLRKPIGLSLFDEDLKKEVDDFHLGIYHDVELIGTLVLSPLTDSVKMRQVAVTEFARGIGAGARLIKFSEEFAKQKGFSQIVLHARKTAVPFYLKYGYRVEGSEFVEVSIPHYKMVKEI